VSFHRHLVLLRAWLLLFSSEYGLILVVQRYDFFYGIKET
jgi:hypothetical protein